MEDGKPTDATDEGGKEPDKPVEETQDTDDGTEKSPAQKLKEENDNLEKELIRQQKIRNEMLLAGTGGGHVEPEPKKPLTDLEYSEALERGEVNPMKEDGIKF